MLGQDKLARDALARRGHASSPLSSTQDLLATHTETAQPVRKEG